MFAFHDAEVVKELQLTADQKQRLHEIEADAFFPGPDPGKGPGDRGPGDRGPGDRGPGDRGPRPEQGVRGVEKFVGGLAEEQKQRWKEMTGEPFKGRMGPSGPPPHGPPPDGPPHGPDPHGPPPRRGPQPPEPPDRPPGE